MRRNGFAALLLIASSTASAATLVKAGRLLDPRTGNVVAPAAVLIEGERIKEVGPPERVRADAPGGTETIVMKGGKVYVRRQP
jgi:imidazolonepropionase-like amidohydrolase